MKNISKILLIIALLCLTATMAVSCDSLFGDSTTEHIHELTEVAEVKATCTQSGVEAYYTCSGCDKLFADAEGSLEIEAPKVIEASGHDYKKTVYPNSCTEAGYTKYTCLDCDYSYNGDEVAAKGHSFTDYKSNNDATCTEDGTKSAKCDNCDETDTIADIGSKKGHSYTVETVSDDALKSAADCENVAVYYKSCSCGDIDKSENAATFENGISLGHDYTEKVVDEAHLKANATNCQEVDTYWYDCSRCDSVSGELYFASNNAGTHSVSPAWTTKDGKHFHECTVEGCNYTEDEADCSDVLDDKDHKCDVCEADGVTSHEYGNWSAVENTDNHSKTCNCGDVVTEGHAWTETDRNPATHEADGYVKSTCNTCNATKVETLSKITECTYNEEKAEEKYLKSSATCTAAAVYYKSCVCGKFSNAEDAVTFEFGEALGHTEAEWAVKSVDAENQTAVLVYTCSACENPITKNITFADCQKDVVEAKCEEEGSETYTYGYTLNETEKSLVVYTKTLHVLGHDYESVVTDPTCEVQGYTTHTCKNDKTHTYVDSYVDATGHSYSEWTVAMAPDYETEGKLSKTCGNCSGTEEKNIGTISADNGYTLVITGVLSRWTYTANEQTFTFDIAETVDTTDGANTYSYGVEAWYVGLDPNGNPIMENGYKSTEAVWNTTFFGGKNYTYTTTIVAPSDTTVTLILRVARNKTKPFFNDGNEWVLNDLFVNGNADGVIADMSSQVVGDGTTEAWEIFNDYQVATLFLKEGENVITFKTANSTNFAGIGFISTEELHMHTEVYTAATASTCTATGLTYGITCSECKKVIVAQNVVEMLEHGHVWVHTVTTEPTATTEGAIYSENKCNNCGDVSESKTFTLPVISETDYTKIATGVASWWQYNYEGEIFEFATEETVEATTYEFLISEGYDPFAEAIAGSHPDNGTFQINYSVDGSGNRRDFYESTRCATFKANVTVTEATCVSFVVTFVNGNKTYDLNDVISAVSVENSNNNGGVIRCDGTVTTTGWRAKHQGDGIVATILLAEGENTITFTMGELNCNVRGFKIVSTVPVELSTTETEATE